jgi:Protein of unknown function (DUF1236)
MRSKLLIPSAAAILLAGTMFAGAQGQEHQGAAPGAAQEKSMPAGKGGATQGQAQRDDGKGNRGEPVQRTQPNSQKSEQRTTQQKGERNAQQKSERNAQQKNDRNAEKKGDRDNIQTQGQGQREENSRGQREERPQQRDRTQGQGQREQNAQPTQRNERGGSQTETRTNGGGGSVSFTTEQRTKIRETVLRGSSVPRVSKVDFDVRIGTAVPRSVHIVAVPETIVEIHPAWRGFMYFVYNDEIIVVEPGSLKIVAVLDV